MEKYVSEFVGTFLLIFTIGCNVITRQPVWGGVSIACVLTVMIYALGGVSGAHFNPAVTLALTMSGKVKGGWNEAAKYMATQFVAGIVAAFAYVGMFGLNGAFNLEPINGRRWWQACLVEAIYTFMLSFVVLNVAASKVHAGRNEFYGLAIGFVIVAGAYGAGSVSMGCFNPAVAMAVDISSFWIGFQYGPLYMVFEFLGGALAAYLFKVCRPEEAEDPLGKLEEEKGEVKVPEYSETSKMVSEFIGTYMLVLTVGLNVLGGSPAGAFSIAAALMSMIFALGTCSGAHFNPAVTVAIFVSGISKVVDSQSKSARDKQEAGNELYTMAYHYIRMQIVAGIAAGLTYAFIYGGETFALKPAAYLWTQVAMAEFAFTFVLAFVVLSVATVKEPLKNYFGFAIGMCVTAGGVAIGKVSGGSLNPAVSIGISTAHIINGGGLWPCLPYSVIEIAAGGAAAVVFKKLRPAEYDDAKSEATPLKQSA